MLQVTLPQVTMVLYPVEDSLKIVNFAWQKNNRNYFNVKEGKLNIGVTGKEEIPSPEIRIGVGGEILPRKKSGQKEAPEAWRLFF